MMELVSFVSLCSTVATVGFFFIGTQPCLKIYRQSSSGSVPFLPFLSCAVSSTMWAKYGILIHDSSVILVNCIGGIMQAIYIFIYYKYTANKTSLHRQMMMAGFFMFPVLIYVKYFIEYEELASQTIGMIASCLSIIVYGSPLATVVRVVRTKSTESMIFSFSLASFIVSWLWCSYGYLILDRFIMVPNLIGGILASVQLAMFALYPSKSTKAYYDVSKLAPTI